MPKLKLKMESAVHEYLTGKVTDKGFKEAVQAILREFKGKSLLHQNIGQLTLKMERENPSRKTSFERIWSLLDQVSPRIRVDLNRRMQRGPHRRNARERE